MEQSSTTSRQAGQKKSTLQNRDRHLRKTRLCVFFQQGVCHRQSTCQFAHGKSELQDAPVLYKTRICPKGDGCSNKNCTYAHSQEELQISDVSFKTAMCHWHAKGMCSSGKSCRFAHDMKELRGTHGEQQGKAPKVVSKAGKAKNNANDEVLRQNSNTAADRMVEAHTFDKNDLAPAFEEIKNLLNPCINNLFIQLDANTDYTSDWDVPVKVHSKLSTEVGFLDSLYFPRGFQLSIPETPPCQLVNEFPQDKPTDQADQGISCLVTKVRDLSEEVRTLQLQVAQQHRICQGYSSDKSKSTKSGSVFSYSADDSSSACTPRTTQQKLAQLKAFSKDLQSAFDLNMK